MRSHPRMGQRFTDTQVRSPCSKHLSWGNRYLGDSGKELTFQEVDAGFDQTSYLGNFGSRFNRDFTATMAALLSAMP